MRKKKWLRRGAYLIVLLLLLYVVFWVALFNPLEGSIEKMESMVPDKVGDDYITYFLHAPWGKVRASEFFRLNVWESPVRPRVEESLELEDFFYGPIKDIEAQVNESLPGFLGEFSILEDIAGTEVVLAGNLTGPGEDLGSKILNSSFLLLTRISYKSRFMEVLKYQFVRDQIPGLKAYRDFYEFDVGAEYVREGSPEGAGLFYFARVKDVLLVANDRELMEQAVHLSEAAKQGGPQSEESLPRYYWFYYDVRAPSQDPGFTFWVKVANADSQLGHELEEIGVEPEGKVKDFVKALFPVGLTTSATLRFDVEDGFTLGATGKIRMAKQLPGPLEALHQYQGGDLKGSLSRIAKVLPEERTFALAWLSMDARDFLLNLLPALDSGSRQLYFAENGTGWDLKRMATQVGDWFEGGVALSWARLPDVDAINLDTWEGGTPEPKPGMTLFLTLKENLDPEDLVDFFMRNQEKFGLEAVTERTAPVGRLFEMKVPVDLGLQLFKPAFALLDHQFIFCSNQGELLRILETAAGKTDALADGPRFKAAMDRVHKRGNLFIYADVIRQAPFVLDQRWQWAFEATNFNRVEFRNEVVIRLNREHSDWNTKRIREEADREVDLRMRTRQEVEFPEAIEKYRDSMFWLDPFEWLVLSANVSGDGAGTRLDVKGAVRLRPVEEE